MDIDIFSASELPMVLRVLRTALNPDSALVPTERLFIETYATIAGTAAPLVDPLPIEAWQVAVATPHRRKRLVQLSALAVLLSRPVRPASVAFLKALARQLATHDPVIDVIDALQHGRHLRVRLLALRRGMRVLLKEAYQAEGVLGVLRFVGALWFKTTVNKDRLWHYKRLGLLPDGTLGREYWKHMTEVGFGFPGEAAGIPDAIAYHDIAHVLADHPATPLGEIQQGSFQAGNRREDGFFFIQFVVLHFHHGVKVAARPSIAMKAARACIRMRVRIDWIVDACNGPVNKKSADRLDRPAPKALTRPGEEISRARAAGPPPSGPRRSASS